MRKINEQLGTLAEQVNCSRQGARVAITLARHELTKMSIPA